MTIQERAAERAADIAAGKAYTTSWITIFVAGLTLNDVAICVGIVVTIATGVINWYYRSKHYKLAEARAKADGIEVDDE